LAPVVLPWHHAAVRRVLVVLTLTAGCTDQALVDVNARLDDAIRREQAKSTALMARAKAMADVRSTNPLVTGGETEVRRLLEALGVDRVAVEDVASERKIRAEGDRGGGQIVGFLARLGTEAPALVLENLELREDVWTIDLTVDAPKSQAAAAAVAKDAPIGVPDPSFLSFDEGARLHARALKKQQTLEQIRAVVQRLEGREAAAEAGAAASPEAAARARARRHLAMKILPFGRDGALEFDATTGVWRGKLTFESFEDARRMLAAVGEVVAYERGERPTLTVTLKH
jgi:hypothetical protein